ILDSIVDVRPGGRVAVAFHEVGLARCAPLECALSEQVMHKGPHVEADLSPQRRVIWLEDYPLESAIKTLLDEQRRAPHRNEFPFRSPLVVALERSRAPDDRSIDREAAD